MPDRLSAMLDIMILAVEEGLSYDGIVSLPGIGLEDFGHRPGKRVGRVDDGMVRPLLPSPATIHEDWSCDSGATSDHHVTSDGWVSRFFLKLSSPLEGCADMGNA